jgi:uncharacterized membrane protein
MEHTYGASRGGILEVHARKDSLRSSDICAHPWLPGIHEQAEKEQLERMKDENLFSTFFPYALALNVADNWTKAFEGIYQEQPSWYVSPGGVSSFRPAVFARSIGSAVSALSSALYSAPRGSGTGNGGFGGGGSSGGGFGGGGGGSW